MHQHDPTPEELRLAVVERALADSKAKEVETKSQLTALINGFQHLELLIWELKPVKTLNTPPTNITPVWLAPTGQPPPLALPNKYDRDRSKGQAFLTSCQTYMQLCPDSFPEEQTKITWALSYMKSSRAVKWAEQVFHWEEKNSGYSKFLDWDEFCNEFQKDFCPAHSDVAAINKLESTTYYQKSWSVDDYLDKFMELVAEAGYTDLKIIVVKFWKGLDPQIQNTIAMMAYGCPSDSSPENWYEAAKNIDQTAQPTKPLKQLTEHQFLPTLCSICSILFSKVSSELLQSLTLSQLRAAQHT